METFLLGAVSLYYFIIIYFNKFFSPFFNGFLAIFTIYFLHLQIKMKGKSISEIQNPEAQKFQQTNGLFATF